MKRLIVTLGKLPYRVLVNVGDYGDAYEDVPDNCHLESWYPQPSVIAQVDAVLHHGGNNSFNECLFFGKPALIMPYCWDGHDNASRIQETGYGLKMERYTWSDGDIENAIRTMLTDKAMQDRLARLSAHMQAQDGRRKGAEALDKLLKATAS
jgi:UDP:flavonoid glycosyltransferase YjiC (YdhE family)